MFDKRAWQSCVDFHGHSCPGLAIGFKAAEGALIELGISSDTRSVDEELVCVTENDACCVDAIQVLLGCTYGKGNLVARLRGKMAFSFFLRDTGQSVRLVLKPDLWPEASREERTRLLIESPHTNVFDVMAPPYKLPEEARLFASHRCAVCGESTAECFLRIQDGAMVCLDCYEPYGREGF